MSHYPQYIKYKVAKIQSAELSADFYIPSNYKNVGIYQCYFVGKCWYLLVLRQQMST